MTALSDLIVGRVGVTGQPVRPFFDSDDVASDADWRYRILESRRHSKVLLVCLSPNYFADAY